MAPQITGGFHISLIKKTMDKMGSGTALNCGAVENMTFAVVNVLDHWERLEENVYRCIPLLLELS
jgi:hypothetical protein